MSQLDLVVNKEAVGVGDNRVYVGGHTGGGAGVVGRQALHATTISFKHPTEKRSKKLVAPLYEDMRAALGILRKSMRFKHVANPGATVDLAVLGLGE